MWKYINKWFTKEQPVEVPYRYEDEIVDEPKVSKNYFTIDELTRSTVASVNNIANTPDAIELDHINELIVVLNDLRESWGSAIQVNSGFRSKELNKLVGGVSTSGHLTGYAADLYPVNGKFNEFKEHCLTYFKDIKYDELIIEKNSAGSQWVHFSLFSIKGLQRNKTFTLNVK